MPYISQNNVPRGPRGPRGPAGRDGDGAVDLTNYSTTAEIADLVAAAHQRANHTGTQAQSTITNLTDVLDSKVNGLGGVKSVRYAATLPAWTSADEGTLIFVPNA